MTTKHKEFFPDSAQFHLEEHNPAKYHIPAKLYV